MNDRKDIEALKRRMRGMLNMAAMRGRIEGFCAIEILQSLSAEFVAKLSSEEHRRGCIDDVVRDFPMYVEIERMSVEGMVRQ